MNETTNTGEPVPVEAALELGKWMGRHQAFGQMAGRCSAAEIESLRQIREGKLYQSVNCNWEEFCTQHLRVSARTVERELANLRRFGPAYFTVRQLARISTREYAAIAGCITGEGVRVNGELVELDQENGEKVADAVKALLAQNPPSESMAAPITFDSAMQRFRAALDTLCCFEGELDAERAHTLRMEVAKLRSAAASWGVEIASGNEPA